MTLKTDEGGKFKVPWTEVLKIVAALCVPAAGALIWMRVEISVIKHSQDSFESTVATAIVTIKDIIKSEAEHTREIARLQFSTFGDRLDRHEEIIEELQKERRSTYQITPRQ